MRLRIGLTGGGSGGHVYPLKAVCEALVKKHPDSELHYFGPNDRYAEILAPVGAAVHSIVSSKIRRYASGLLGNLLDIPRFGIGLLQALWKLFWVMPDVLFSKGGPGAFPVVLAAWLYRIPIVIHESDAAPGLTNLMSARFASRIAVSWDRAQRYFDPQKTIVTGQPLRTDLSSRSAGDQAKAELHFDPGTPLILVLGGSQGSVRINEMILANLPELLKDAQILHQTGPANLLEVQKLAQAELLEMPVAEEAKTRYQPVAYVENMQQALAAADLVISRASSTIFEVALFGKPSILIPILESANDHQRVNAYEFARTGAATVIEEPNLLPGIFLNQVREILRNSEGGRKMGDAARAFVKPGAAEALAAEILALAEPVK